MTRTVHTIVGAIAIIVALPTFADVINVPGDFPTVQDAIDAAGHGDEIVIAPGRYLESINPFGKAVTIRSTDPDDPEVVAETILDGGGEDPVVVMYSQERATTIVAGLTITNGLNSVGGGIAMLGADPTFRQCVIRDNVAENQGGGAYASLASPWFDRCTFENNRARDGGAIHVFLSDYTRIDECLLTGNVATNDGGAVDAQASGLRVYRSLVAGNTAEGGLGGGLTSTGARFYVVNSIVRDNEASFGGGIGLPDGPLWMYGSTVVRNRATAGGGGGAIWGYETQPIIRNSIIRDNGANPLDGLFQFNPTAEYSNVEGGLSGPGMIDVDAQFVDPDNDDFRLAPGSPSVNTGFDGWVASFALHDLDGDRRISGAQVDMGPYEIQENDPPAERPQGQLVLAIKDNGLLLFGYDTPIAMLDVDTGEWSTVLRNQPTFAIAADPEERCFWAHNGETFMLVKIPYDTLVPEEIALVKFENDLSCGLSGLAVRDGVLYASLPFPCGLQPEGLYTLDKATGQLEIFYEVPEDYEIYDMQYEAATDRLLLLSNGDGLPPGPLGIFEIDLDTLEIIEIQRWVNENPFDEAAALQGMAVGAGRNFILRPLYNDLQVWDSQSQEIIERLPLPSLFAGQSWVLGGLAWAPEFAATCAGDVDGSGVVDFGDLLAVLAAYGSKGGPEDVDGDGSVAFGDIVVVLSAWGPCE